uniref:restriction endonuclease subunit S n=1 Tax=Senegalimassilia anaerobia TaxID=1473216 RepID=UPI00350E4052
LLNDRANDAMTQLNGYLAAICETISSELCQDIDGELKELCSLVTDKSDCKNAILETYVSTESLLPGKSGRQFAGSVPTTGKVSVFKSGDTLVSNIRPYFKKIWYASEDGTCSSDVLVFRAFNPDEAPYLNACLRQDRFFDYVMRGAKGTKMPRGDKKQIMGFPIARSCDAGDLTVLSGLVKQMTRNEIESHRLTELRDVLLPKLMSGEIDVSRVDLTQLNSHLAADLSNWYWYRVVNRHIRQVETETWLCAPWLFLPLTLFRSRI